MAKGIYYNLLPRYALSFSDAGGIFVQEVHLDYMGERKAAAQGLDITKTNLEALCCDPREGSPRIRHGMKASVTPSFDGLEGTFSVRGRPRSELIPQTRVEGLTYVGIFTESAASASDGMEAWIRRRFVPDGSKTLTGGPSGAWQTQTVQLAFISERGDELDDFAPVNAQVTALVGTLLPGDIVSREPHGTFEVRGVEVLGEYEKARLLR